MPINVFGNSNSNNSNNKIDTSLFVQKPYLRSNYIEADIEEDIDLKNRYRIKNLPDPTFIGEPVSKIYNDNLFNDPSILKNSAHIDLNDRNITNARFIQVNQLPQIDSHLTAKLYVDNSISDAIDEPSLLRLHPDEKLKQDSIFLNSTLTSPKTIIELPTKSYVVSLHEINRNRQDLSSVINDQDIEFDNNILTNLDSVTVNRNPTSDNEVSNKKYVDQPIGEGTIVGFNQTLQNYLKLSVGNNTYDLTEYDKIQFTDTTEIKYPNTGGYLLQNWVIKSNEKNNNDKIQNFIKSTKTNSLTGFSGAESLLPIGNGFMYIETSSNIYGNNVFVSFERTDNIQISNISFYYNGFSITTDDNFKNTGRFRIQLLLKIIHGVFNILYLKIVNITILQLIGAY